MALTVMLIMAAAPLVMGGVEVDSDGISAVSDPADPMCIEIAGNIIIKSSLPKDINDLALEIYVTSDKSYISERIRVIDVGPIVVESNTSVDIPIEGVLQIPAIVSFLLADNDGDGVYIPLDIKLRAAYGGLVGLDLEVNLDVPLSETATLDCDVKKNENGEIREAIAEIQAKEGDQLLSIITMDRIDAILSVDGVGGIRIAIDKGADNKVTVLVTTDIDDGELITDGILELAKKMIESDTPTMMNFEGSSYPIDDLLLEEITYYLGIYFGGMADA